MSAPSRNTGLFRPEALAAHDRALARGDVLRLPPFWVVWCYRVVAVAAVAAVGYLVVARVPEVAEGPLTIECPAAVRAAPAAATVERVAVRTGDRVAVGQLLVELGGIGAEDRLVRAATPGVVGAVGAEVGRRVAAGDPLVAILDDSRPSAVVTVPARFLPRIAVGMPLSIALGGESSDPVPLARVGEAAIGDAVLVGAALPADRAAWCGRTGQGRVIIGSTRMIAAILPGG